MEQNANNTNEIERCNISELSRLVDSCFRDYGYKYSNPNVKEMMPVGFMLTPLKQAIDELYSIASSLLQSVGQVELDDKHDWSDVDIRGLQELAKLFHIPPIEREVYYNVDISDKDQSFLKKLETIYGEDTRDAYCEERHYIAEYLNDWCLRWLNNGDEEYAWKVSYVFYRGDEKCITLDIEAYRKDKDNAID